MGFIKQKIRIGDTKADYLVNALIDTGSNATIIREDVAINAGLVIKEPERARNDMTTADKKKSKISGISLIKMKIQGCTVDANVAIKKDLVEEAIIGTNILQDFESDIDMEKDTFKIRKCALKEIIIVSSRITEQEEDFNKIG